MRRLFLYIYKYIVYISSSPAGLFHREDRRIIGQSATLYAVVILDIYEHKTSHTGWNGVMLR